MKNVINFVLFILTFIFSILPAIAQKNITYKSEFPILTGPYLGQISPGVKAAVFLPDILSGPRGSHTSIVFTLDGKEAYWCRDGIWFSKLEKGKWITPQLLPFSKKEYDDDAPFLSPDGTRLFFTSKRPTISSDQSRKENIWVVNMTEEGWSEARPLPPIVNRMFQHWQVTVDMKGNLYFGHRIRVEGDKDIYVSEYITGDYQNPKKLSKMVNSELNDNNPYISPNGDYLIFSRFKDGKPFDGGLFISFRLNIDDWSEAEPLNHYINFEYAGNCGIVTQDSKYLFFLDGYKGEWERYWISAKFIDELKLSVVKSK